MMKRAYLILTLMLTYTAPSISDVTLSEIVNNTDSWVTLTFPTPITCIKSTTLEGHPREGNLSTTTSLEIRAKSKVTVCSAVLPQKKSNMSEEEFLQVALAAGRIEGDTMPVTPYQKAISLCLKGTTVERTISTQDASGISPKKTVTEPPLNPHGVYKAIINGTYANEYAGMLDLNSVTFTFSPAKIDPQCQTLQKSRWRFSKRNIL